MLVVDDASGAERTAWLTARTPQGSVIQLDLTLFADDVSHDFIVGNVGTLKATYPRSSVGE